MAKTYFHGRLSYRLRSLCTLLGVTTSVLARRAVGRPLVPQWPVAFEIGTLFYRRQFDHAFSLPDIAQGRAYFDSLYTVAEPAPPVDRQASRPGEPKGEWFIPKGHNSPLTLLYFHGGGYTFHPQVTQCFIAMLAHRLQMPVFSVDYRLTPEHPHPAQIDDALAAYRFLIDQGTDPSTLVIGGDSAGGHLVLMTLIAVRDAKLPQPALALALSPWTDIGRRGESQFGNDRYDMVQGYQTLQYGEWLRGNGPYTETQLSPMGQYFGNVAPIYIQAGGKEILVDMIRDFARQMAVQGGRVRLDVWPHMTHEFHAYGSTLAQSHEALAQLRAAITWVTSPQHPEHVTPLAPTPVTEMDTLTL